MNSREERKKAKMQRKGIKKEDLEINGEEEDDDEGGPRIESKGKGNRKQAEKEEDSDDYEPDLSWLPDPDKVYGPKASDEDEDDFVPLSYSNAMSSSKEAKKRKKSLIPELNERETPKKKSKKSKSRIDTDLIDKDLMEELALKLLQK